MILHLDMDAFYAAIEQRDDPSLRGRPVVVGSPPDKRGVVCTASYEARVFGIHSAMPSRTAGKLCPHADFLPVNMTKYVAVSRQIRAIMDQFTPLIEPISIDEAFLDITGAMLIWKDPVSLTRALKERIREELALTASVGLAPNKFLAKLASDMHKPDGMTIVPQQPDEILTFLAPLPVSRIWGVGKAAQEKLKRFGIEQVDDVQPHDEETLQRWLGEAFGSHLWRLARGLDDRPVVTEREAKSISNEHTFDKDCDDLETVRHVLIELTEQVGRRARSGGKQARTGQIKLRFDDFDTKTRRQPFPQPTQSDRDFLACALSLFDAQTIDRPIRLIGFGVSNFESEKDRARPVQGDLFISTGPHDSGPDEELDQAVDKVRETFGHDSLKRGGW
jgi:DNA polymerase-4